MGPWGTSAKSLLVCSFLILGYPIGAPHAEASSTQQGLPVPLPAYNHYAGRLAFAHGAPFARQRARGQYAASGISCVPYARSDSGISVAGNAWQWWDNAAGVYARGSAPEAGSVLTFRANGRMRLGHVAVVSRVINPREIEIEHANWWGGGARGGVARNTPVVDVSEANDWTAVRVGLGQSGEFGSVYPTYGFIYDRPDNGVMVAARGAPALQQALNPAPSDLRPAADRSWQTYEEVAEAPIGPKRHKRAVHPVSTRAHQTTLERQP
jgi:hypothetical protein